MKYFVVSHDAGGAEIVSSWVRRNPEHKYRFILEGPALQICQRKLAHFENSAPGDLRMILEEVDHVLTGTSSIADLERRAIKAAREAGKPSTAFLDYWHGFRERFVMDGESCLPDELWVGDRYALDIARNTFDSVPVKYVENPYLLDVRDEADEKRSALESIRVGKNPKGYQVLYLCQPFDQGYTTESGQPYLVTDEMMLRFFFDNLKTHLDTFPLESVLIRLHPAEDPSKYDRCIGEFAGSIPISISRNRTLVEDCVCSDLAVGTHTMALVVALACETPTFHCIPAGCHPFMLPHKEIGDFFTFLEELKRPERKGNSV
jgi:hypothetical protein